MAVALVAAGGAGREPLQHLERLPDGRTVRGCDLARDVGVAQGVEHGDRLRSGAGDGEADAAGVVRLALVITPHHRRDQRRTVEAPT